jgi:uncharacterized LabA/DUF88 family protein
MSQTYNRWMMFVDGENLTFGAQRAATERSVNLDDQKAFPNYLKDVYFWPPGRQANHQFWVKEVHSPERAERCYYYTCSHGDANELNRIRDCLCSIHFSPVVIHKPRGMRAKGVDISLTKDMLLQAFLNNYDVAVLVTGDGDFIPVVEEVKRFGKRVVVAFWDTRDLNSDSRRAADEFSALELSYS